MTIDFKQPEGRALLERLIAKADVLVENFRPGTLTKMGLDYASLARKYPRLVSLDFRLRPQRAACEQNPATTR